MLSEGPRPEDPRAYYVSRSSIIEDYARPSWTSWVKPSDTHAGLGIHQRSEKKQHLRPPCFRWGRGKVLNRGRFDLKNQSN